MTDIKSKAVAKLRAQLHGAGLRTGNAPIDDTAHRQAAAAEKGTFEKIFCGFFGFLCCNRTAQNGYCEHYQEQGEHLHCRNLKRRRFVFVSQNLVYHRSIPASGEDNLQQDGLSTAYVQKFLLRVTNRFEGARTKKQVVLTACRALNYKFWQER